MLCCYFYWLGQSFWYGRPFHSCGPDKEYWCLLGVFGLVWPGSLVYLSQRVQCIKSENLLSLPLPVTKGVPQGSILGPTLFSIYIKIAQALGSSLIHLHADDTVLYSAGPSPDFVLNSLQESFLSVQQAFSTLNLVLNTSKTCVITTSGFIAWGSHLIQVLGSMARQYTVLLSAHIKAAG